MLRRDAADVGAHVEGAGDQDVVIICSRRIFKPRLPLVAIIAQLDRPHLVAQLALHHLHAALGAVEERLIAQRAVQHELNALLCAGHRRFGRRSLNRCRRSRSSRRRWRAPSKHQASYHSEAQKGAGSLVHSFLSFGMYEFGDDCFVILVARVAPATRQKRMSLNHGEQRISLCRAAKEPHWRVGMLAMRVHRQRAIGKPQRPHRAHACSIICQARSAFTATTTRAFGCG